MGGSSESDGVSELIAWRQLLSCSMDDAEELAEGLERSHIRLQGVGSRLPSLRACIAPLQARSEQALGVSSRIDQAMSSACAVVERFEQLRRLEKAIQVSDPQADIGGYLLAVSELEEGLRFLASNCAPTLRRLREVVDFMAADARYNSRMQRMSESLRAIEDDWKQQQHQEQLVALEGGVMKIAVKKLEQEFQRLLEEAGRTALPLPSRLLSKKSGGGGGEREVVELPLEIHVVQQLRTIAKRMASIGQVERCVRVFVEQRSAKVRERLLELKADYLVQLHLRSVKGVDMSEWCMLEKLIGEWSAHMELVVKLVYMGERRLCHKLFAGLVLPEWSECLARVAQPGMTLFLQFGESVARSRRVPEKLFKLLDMFETLHNLDPSIALVFQGCTHIRLRLRELQKLIVEGACGVFWEFGRQVASHGSSAASPQLPPPQDAAVHKLISYVVNYVKYLVSEFYSPIMEQVLKIEDSWKRRGCSNGGDRANKEQKETLLLERAVVRIMESLESAIDGQSKWYTEPIHHRIFLMNNAYYMFKRIKGSELGVLLGDAWLKQRRARVQQHALGYQMEGWGKVLGQLSRDGLLLSSSSSRATAAASRDIVRQRLEAFSCCMEEICDKHRHVVIPDPELRDATCLAVVQNIVPAYRSYLQSYGPFIDTRFIKYSADNVEQMLGNLFQ